MLPWLDLRPENLSTGFKCSMTQGMQVAEAMLYCVDVRFHIDYFTRLLTDNCEVLFNGFSAFGGHDQLPDYMANFGKFVVIPLTGVDVVRRNTNELKDAMSI